MSAAGLAYTGNGSGVAHAGTDEARAGDAIARVTAFIAGL